MEGETGDSEKGMTPHWFVIPCKLPSNNKLSGHRWARTNWVKLYLKELVPLTKAKRWKGKAHLTITRGLGARERFYDPDNCVGGCKPLIDALKLAGYIEDDSFECLILDVHQVRSTGGSYIEVDIRGLASPIHLERAAPA